MIDTLHGILNDQVDCMCPNGNHVLPGFSIRLFLLKSKEYRVDTFTFLPFQTLSKAIKLAQHCPLSPSGDPHVAFISTVNLLYEFVQ